MLKNTSWQVIVASIMTGIGAVVSVISQTPLIGDTKTGQQILTIGGAILGFGTAFGFYHAKGKAVTTNPKTGENEPIDKL